MRSLDDLPEDVGQILVVVSAVDARDVLLRRAIRPAVRVAGEPVRVRLEEIVGGAIRVHPRHHEEPVVVRRFRQLPEEVAAVEELRTMVQRILARVVGDDAAGVDDNGLDLRALPLGAPPGDVIADRILFRDVGLAPQVGAAIPGRRTRGALIGLRSRRGVSDAADDERRSRGVLEEASARQVSSSRHGLLRTTSRARSLHERLRTER